MQRIPLVDAIEVLREQLIEVVNAAGSSPVRFGVRELELSMEVAVTRTGEGHAGITFWLVDFGAKGEVSDAVTHRVTLRLDPIDAAGRAIKLSNTAAGEPPPS